MVFNGTHCSDTVCTPSRYGLLTGRAWRTELKRGVFGSERPCLIKMAYDIGIITCREWLCNGHGG